MAQAPQRVNLSPQQQADLSSMFYELSHDPTTRDAAAALVAKKFPDRAKRSFRDVEQKRELAEWQTAVEDKIDLKGAKAAKAKQDEQRTKLAERYSEDHMKGIDAVAAELGISDLDSAAIIYSHRNPETDPTLQPPSPADRPGATWEFPTVRGKDGKEMDFKSFAADPKTHSLNAAYNIITEFKNNKLSPAFRR